MKKRYSLKSIKKPVQLADEYSCDYCGGYVDGFRDAFRKNGKSHLKFCNRECRANHQKWHTNNNKKCIKCGKSQSKESRYFTKGYCLKCYKILKRFSMNSELADVYSVKKQLSREVANVRYN